ncbi:hypothetical protein ACDX78_19280 [Virgibacillus oceani]
MGVRLIVQNTAALFETMYLHINFEDLELGEIVKQPPYLKIIVITVSGVDVFFRI